MVDLLGYIFAITSAGLLLETFLHGLFFGSKFQRRIVSKILKISFLASLVSVTLSLTIIVIQLNLTPAMGPFMGSIDGYAFLTILLAYFPLFVTFLAILWFLGWFLGLIMRFFTSRKS